MTGGDPFLLESAGDGVSSTFIIEYGSKADYTGKRQAANAQSLGGPASGLFGSATGLLGSLTGGNPAQGVMGTVGGLVKNPTGALDGLGLGGATGIVGSTVGQAQGVLNGLPLVGGLVGNVGGTVNGLPVVGGLVGGLTGGGGASGGLSGTLNGLPLVGGLTGGLTGDGGLSGTLNGLPIVGGLTGGLTGGLGGTINGHPVVGGLVGGLGGTVNGLPVVGGLVGGLTNGGAINLGADPLGAAGSAATHNIPNAQGVAGTIQQANGAVGSAQQQVTTAGVPTLLANLGDGRYLLSNGQVLSLGNLGNLSNLGGVAGGVASQLGNLGAGAGGLVGGLTGQAQGIPGTVGGLANAQQPLDTARSALGGLSGIGPDGLAQVDSGKFVNIAGQLYPLDQARQILHQQGLDLPYGSYTADLSPAGEAYDEGNSDSTGSGEHITPAQAFQASDPNSNGTYSSNPNPANSPIPDQGSNSTIPAPETDGAATNTLLASIPKGFEEEDEPWSDADIENDGRWEQLQHGVWEDQPTASTAKSASAGEEAKGKGVGGYANPFPEYRYTSDEGALDLVAGLLGAPRPTPSASGTSTSSASTSASASASSSGTSPDGSGVSGLEWIGKQRQGWGKAGMGYNRPPQASSSTYAPGTLYPSATASDGAEGGEWTSYPAPSATAAPAAPSAPAQEGEGEGEWEDDTWGEWVSAQATPSASR